MWLDGIKRRGEIEKHYSYQIAPGGNTDVLVGPVQFIIIESGLGQALLSS